MNSGYLALQTHPEHPGLVRLLCHEQDPRTVEAFGDTGKIRYVLRFFDIETAKLHGHNVMRHKLKDINQGLYQSSLGAAMGDLQSIELRHEEVWRDADISAQELADFEQEKAHETQRHQRRDRIIQIIKWLAIGLLALNLLAPFIGRLLQ